MLISWLNPKFDGKLHLFSCVVLLILADGNFKGYIFVHKPKNKNRKHYIKIMKKIISNWYIITMCHIVYFHKINKPLMDEGYLLMGLLPMDWPGFT